MSNKYFRLMEDPEPTWKPFRERPMSDDHPELGTYKSTVYISHPQQGDYLIQSGDGSVYANRPSYSEHFDNVEFEAMPSMQELQAKSLVVEVPADIARKEFYLQEKISDLELEIHTAEEHLEDLERDMAERRFGFHTKAAREAKKEYNALKPVVMNMNKQFGELGAQLHWQVVEPLKELQKQQSQKHKESLAQKISQAQGITRQHQEQSVGLVKGKETNHDR